MANKNDRTQSGTGWLKYLVLGNFILVPKTNKRGSNLGREGIENDIKKRIIIHEANLYFGYEFATPHRPCGALSSRHHA